MRRHVAWDQMIHADNDLAAFTAKHLYFSGPKEKFRTRHDRIVERDPFVDGFRILRSPEAAPCGQRARMSVGPVLRRKPQGAAASPQIQREEWKGRETTATWRINRRAKSWNIGRMRLHH